MSCDFDGTFVLCVIAAASYRDVYNTVVNNELSARFTD